MRLCLMTSFENKPLKNKERKNTTVSNEKLSIFFTFTFLYYEKREEKNSEHEKNMTKIRIV